MALAPATLAARSVSTALCEKPRLSDNGRASRTRESGSYGGDVLEDEAPDVTSRMRIQQKASVDAGRSAGWRREAEKHLEESASLPASQWQSVPGTQARDAEFHFSVTYRSKAPAPLPLAISQAPAESPGQGLTGTDRDRGPVCVLVTVTATEREHT